MAPPPNTIVLSDMDIQFIQQPSHGLAWKRPLGNPVLDSIFFDGNLLLLCFNRVVKTYLFNCPPVPRTPRIDHNYSVVGTIPCTESLQSNCCTQPNLLSPAGLIQSNRRLHCGLTFASLRHFSHCKHCFFKPFYEAVHLVYRCTTAQGDAPPPAWP